MDPFEALPIPDFPEKTSLPTFTSTVLQNLPKVEFPVIQFKDLATEGNKKDYVKFLICRLIHSAAVLSIRLNNDSTPTVHVTSEIMEHVIAMNELDLKMTFKKKKPLLGKTNALIIKKFWKEYLETLNEPLTKKIAMENNAYYVLLNFLKQKNFNVSNLQ